MDGGCCEGGGGRGRMSHQSRGTSTGGGLARALSLVCLALPSCRIFSCTIIAEPVLICRLCAALGGRRGRGGLAIPPGKLGRSDSSLAVRLSREASPANAMLPTSPFPSLSLPFVRSSPPPHHSPFAQPPRLLPPFPPTLPPGLLIPSSPIPPPLLPGFSPAPLHHCPNRLPLAHRPPAPSPSLLSRHPLLRLHHILPPSHRLGYEMKKGYIR